MAQAHDASRIQIQEHREITPAFARGKRRNIRSPDASGLGDCKLAPKMIAHDRLGVRAVSRNAKSPAAARDELGGAHQAPDSFITHPNPPRPQRPLEPQPAIRLATFGVCHPYLDQ